MRCRLCNRTATLVNSHVLPEFLFKPCYDQKHRARQVALPEFQRAFLQKGHRERLLCLDCEVLFSRYERYFSEVWYGPRRKRPLVAPALGFRVSGLDYARFKLFHLSILWRAGVSSRDEYKRVSLGPHTERIAAHFLREDPGPAWEYPLGAMALVVPATRRLLEGFIVSPGVKRVGGHTLYVFLFGGCAWCYCVSSHRLADFPTSLSEEGELIVPCQKFQEFPPMKDILVRWGMAMLEGK